jgi:hypothetical protein
MITIFRRPVLLAALLGTVLLVPVLAAATGETDIRVTPVVTAGHVLASFSAPDAFTADSSELVKNGVPITFTYLVELRRPSSIWFDRTVGTSTVSARVKFDSLTTMFQVTKEQDGHVTWAKSTGKEDEMRTWVTAFDAVPVMADEPLEANADYYVRVRLDARPRLKFSLWPFGRTDAAGRADFTFIR